MKYSIHTLQDDEENFYHCVFEEASEQVIDFFYFLDDAEDCSEFMENGGAFDGFTPQFMLKRVEIQQDVNTIFNETFL